MKNSVVFAPSSTPGIAKIENRAGPRRTRSTSSGYSHRCLISAIRRSYKLDSGFATMPLAPTGSVSRIQRCAARSWLSQPSQSVGACGPTWSSRSHSSARSDLANVTSVHGSGTAEVAAEAELSLLGKLKVGVARHWNNGAREGPNHGFRREHPRPPDRCTAQARSSWIDCGRHSGGLHWCGADGGLD